MVSRPDGTMAETSGVRYCRCGGFQQSPGLAQLTDAESAELAALERDRPPSEVGT